MHCVSRTYEIPLLLPVFIIIARSLVRYLFVPLLNQISLHTDLVVLLLYPLDLENNNRTLHIRN